MRSVPRPVNAPLPRLPAAIAGVWVVDRWRYVITISPRRHDDHRRCEMRLALTPGPLPPSPLPPSVLPPSTLSPGMLPPRVLPPSIFSQGVVLAFTILVPTPVVVSECRCHRAQHE